VSVAADLAAALDGWMVGAEPGERSPYARLAVHDPAGAVLTSHELTNRQAAELAALVADTDPAVAPASVLTELRRFAGPTDAAALIVRIEESGHAAAVEVDARAAGHLTEVLDYGLAQRATARRLIARQTPYRPGQRIQVRTGQRGAGTIAYITVTWPHDPAGQVELWFHVHLDQAGDERPTPFPAVDLAPVPGAGPGQR
jgi:hypothetical protein